MMTPRLIALAVVAAVAARPAAGEPPPPASQPQDIDRLRPGQWLEVPDSHLDKVAFAKWPEIRRGAVRNVMGAWCGAAYDSRRERLVVWGGGHSDYAGNEIYVFDVKKLAWERLNDPSLNIDNGRGETYPDGSPRSVHTYDYIEYLPQQDRFCSLMLGATWPSGVGGGTAVWLFDFETKKWERKSARPEKPGTDPSAIAGSALDPVTGNALCTVRGGSFWEWDPAADKWTPRHRGRGISYMAIGVMDPVGRKYFSIGGKSFTRFDLAAPEAGMRQELEVKGPADMVNAYAPGLEYDPVLDKIVGWNGGASLLLLDPETLEWSKVPPAADNKSTPTPACRTGTYGRFRYIPSLNLYVVVNATSENVFFGRLSDRSAQPIPPRFVAALKTSRDAALVKWVAGEVAKWPKDKADPVLQAARDRRAD